MNEHKDKITAHQIEGGPIYAIQMELTAAKNKYPILWIDTIAGSFAPSTGVQTYEQQKVGAELGTHVEEYVRLAQFARASLTVLQQELAERTRN